MEKILTSASGRYRVLKLLQYISKFVLLLARHKRIRLSAASRDRLGVLIGQCSLQRRILQLGNMYRPLKMLLTAPIDMKVNKVNWKVLASATAALVEDFSEDAFTLSQLGWLPRHFQRLAIYADRAWLVSLVIELHAWTISKRVIHKRKQIERLLDQRPKNEEITGRALGLRREEWWLDIDGVRIICDAGQAWCDVFDVEVFDGFVVGCALTSAVLGMYKFVVKV